MTDVPPGAGIPPPGGPGALSTRTDKSPGQPVRVSTGLPYGQAKALENAQQAVPLPQGTPPPAGGAPGSTASPPGPPAATPPGMGPNPLALLSHPTQRPMEPLNTLSPDLGVGQSQPAKVSDLIDRVAQAGNIQSLKRLANQARMFGQ